MLEKLKKLVPDEGRWIVILIGMLLAIVVIATSGLVSRKAPDSNYDVVHGKILSIQEEQLFEDPYIEEMHIGRQYLKVEMTSGAYKGNVFEVQNSMSRFFNYHAEEGKEMLFTVRVEEGGNYRVEMYGYSRESFVYILIALFFAILIIVGRKKGFYAVLSLTITTIMIVFFMIPQIIAGHSPIMAAVITAVIAATMSITMVSGVNIKSIAAVIGIVLGIAVAGTISLAAGQIARISGLHTQYASEMIYLSQEISIRVPELLFAGVIIASLGAVMDMGISIASSVFEVHSVDRKLGLADLYKSGMNVGRDVIGTMSNTLILAFAGSSLNTLIIIVLNKLPYIRLINLDLLSVELIQGISGCIGVILTVPITAFCAAFLANQKKEGSSL